MPQPQGGGDIAPSGFTFQPIAFVRSPYARRIDAPQATVDLALHNIKADGARLLAEFGNERQTDITEANHGNSSHNNTFNPKR